MSVTDASRDGDEQAFNVTFEGRTVRMAVENPEDQLQALHRYGRFYEIEQLIQHRSLVFHHSTILDVGANVGNHTVFYAAHTTAHRIYPFEPMPAAIRVLKKSIALNGFGDRVDTSFLGLAIAESERTAYVAGEIKNNLGGTYLSPVAYSPDAQSLPCTSLDSLTIEGPVSLIKIDVEGMELAALKGARSLIEIHRPSIAVEVNERNEAEFWQWVDSAEYHVINMFHESHRVRNYIMVARRSH
jgi:FkbM family methyltransferase